MSVMTRAGITPKRRHQYSKPGKEEKNGKSSINS